MPDNPDSLAFLWWLIPAFIVLILLAAFRRKVAEWWYNAGELKKGIDLARQNPNRNDPVPHGSANVFRPKEPAIYKLKEKP
jgi:hypothetical protein